MFEWTSSSSVSKLSIGHITIMIPIPGERQMVFVATLLPTDGCIELVNFSSAVTKEVSQLKGPVLSIKVARQTRCTKEAYGKCVIPSPPPQ